MPTDPERLPAALVASADAIAIVTARTRYEIGYQTYHRREADVRSREHGAEPVRANVRSPALRNEVAWPDEHPQGLRWERIERTLVRAASRGRRRGWWVAQRGSRGSRRA